MTQFNVQKNVHYVSVDVSQTTPYMHSIVTDLIVKHKGKHIAFSPQTEHVIFTEESNLTEFLDELGLKSRITQIDVVI